MGVDPELIGNLASVRIKDTRPHVITTANSRPVIVAAALVVAPCHHKLSIIQRSNRWPVLAP